MNEAVRKYLADKYGEDFDKKAQADYDEQKSKINTGNFFSNLGEAIGGQKVGGSDSYFDNRRKTAKEDTLGKIEKDKQQFTADYDLDRKIADDSRKDAQLKTDDDVNSEGSKIAQSLAVKMGMNPQQAKSLTAAKWKSYSPALEKMYEVEQRKLDRAEARGEKQRLLDEKKIEKEKTLAVPGYSRTGEVTPSTVEVQKIRDAVGFSSDLQKKLERMGELVDENGSFEWGGTAGQEMLSLAKEIQLSGKGKQLYELGVLTGPDLGMLESITSDPSSFSSLITRDSTRKQQVKSQLDSLKNKLQLSAESLGYKKNPDEDGGVQIKVINGKNYKKVQGGWQEI